jgi:hypothetical protein
MQLPSIAKHEEAIENLLDQDAHRGAAGGVAHF